MQNHTIDSLVRDKITCFRVELLTRISPDVLVDEMTCLSLSAREGIKARQDGKGPRLAAGLFLDEIVRFNGFGEQFLLALYNNNQGDLADKLSGNRQGRNVTSRPHFFMGPGGGDMPPTIPNSLSIGDSPPPYFESSEPEDCTNNNNSSSRTKPSALDDSSYTKRSDIPIYEQDQHEELSKYPLPQVTSTESELIPCDSASNASNEEPNQSMNFIGSNERSVSYNIPPSSHGNHESLEKNRNAQVMPANSMSSMEGTGKCHPNIDAILNDTGSADLESLSGASHKSVYNTSDLEFSVSKTLTSGKVMMSDKTLPSSSCLANDSSVDKTLPTDSLGKGQSDCIEITDCTDITCENGREQEDTSDHNLNDAEHEIEPSLQLNQVEPNEPAENNRGVLATMLQGIWFILTLED